MRYRHIYLYGHPIATLAIRTTDEEVIFGVARCRKGDNYSKKIGRSIASGRITKFAPMKYSNLKDALQEAVRSTEIVSVPLSEADEFENLLVETIQKSHDNNSESLVHLYEQEYFVSHGFLLGPPEK